MGSTIDLKAADGFTLSAYTAGPTGGTKGIGAAVAGRLREAGAKVLVTARSRPDVFGPDPPHHG